MRLPRPAGRAEEKGAALIEFAILMPFLILLLIGIIEFAWLFSQNLDVRHGAREGARLAAVNFGGTTTAIVTETCTRMDIGSGATITLDRTAAAVGGEASVSVTKPGDTLTGFIDWAIPSPLNLTSSVEIRLEQAATWTPNPGGTSC